ncbi:BgTH12-02680 [Blumeria graminis f. sp. triticale]|uniref:Bgt-1622 n=3 Tax=Blumeria graminis TaxID=34373 RepID=A0A061HIW4_BLUGR|nr:hypothetical protein BGT96224_1622 [Blumeria graminis f. sp. tritici 96224]CAD6503007.1 BgTH12-02680 [Blumeria graminis f. sp. triticale]VDB88937.1 Bgt-1622 [Blumeria graminis f. sp. tritici]
MDLPGKRFLLNLDTEAIESIGPETLQTPSSVMIRDIQEKSIVFSEVSAPTLKSQNKGFPQPKKRAGRFSKSSSGVTGSEPRPKQIPTSVSVTSELLGLSEVSHAERLSIGQENQQILNSMSTNEIEAERQELFTRLDPSLIERLLKRANLDQGRGDTGTEPQENIVDSSYLSNEKSEESEKTSHQFGTSERNPTQESTEKIKATRDLKSNFDDETQTPIDIHPASEYPIPTIIRPSIHFPTGAATPDLDPSDPAFLETLHSKYFPSLPVDPSKLAWMAPLPAHGSAADQKSSYHPGQSDLPASALRFSFRGGILPPRIARAVPVTKGLHHHGDAPEAAGYTIPELAHLARSAYPAQRCIAFQTLGRLLYRLGRGEWNGEDSDISRGLWSCLRETHVISTLEEAASMECGHQGSKAYAIEAIWLWQKGGGKMGPDPVPTHN